MIKLSDHFSYGKLMRFTISSIIMLVFTSIYGIVDGFFVSNYVGKTEFTAVNFIMPVLLILGCVGFMFGTGGGALISKTIGEGDREKANEYFSSIVYVSILVAIILSLLGIIFLEPIAMLLGAEGDMLEYSVVYGRIILLALPFYVMQYEFQCLFATAEKPKLGLYVTAISGFTNMVLDAVFILVFKWGLAGAAIATAMSQFVGGVIPLIYFARKNTSLLKLGKFKFNGKIILKTCTNGSSEFMSNVSASIVGMIFNYQLMQYAGEDGIAAYGVVMYISMIFQAVFIGYSVGSSPIVSYNYGSNNNEELKSVLKKSLVIISIFSLIMFIAGETLSKPFTLVFASYDENLLNMTNKAFKIYSISFLVSGFSIYGSSFFTALNDGFISALISFLRTFLFQIVALIILPIIFGLNGIWFSIVVAEGLSIIVTITLLIVLKKKYKY